MTTKKLICAISLAIGLASMGASAQQNATAVSGDTRLVTFEYDVDQTYLVLTRPRSVTHIQLRPDERVMTVGAGDTANFVVTISVNRNNILIRPKYPDLTTSLTLITNQRSYPIMLRSTPEGTGKWHQRITWNLQDLVIDDVSEPPAPVVAGSSSLGRRDRRAAGRADNAQGEEPGAATSGVRVDLARMGVNYSIEGDADFRPTTAFDDGSRTYLRFADNLQNLPAIFALEDGEARIINFHVEEKHVVIQGVVPSLVLKLGKAEVKVVRAGAQKRSVMNIGGMFGG